MNKADNVVFNPNGAKEYKGFNFSYTKNFKIFAIIEAIILLIGIGSFIIRGFNWDIDFAGGTVMQYTTDKMLNNSDLDKITGIVEGVIGYAPSSVVKAGDGTQVVIKTLDLVSEKRDEVFQAISVEYNLDPDASNVTSINPTVGKTLANNTIMSVIIAVVLMILYITFRFDFFSGLAAVLCLVCDIFVMTAFYSLLQIPMNTTFIAAILTIFGYSLNASIIIFDRVRENLKLDKKDSFSDIMDKSVNQTLARSLNTTLTTFAIIFMVFILGVDSIRNFVLPLLIGIVSGLFSSVCLSGPLWVFFARNKRPKSKG